MQKKQKLRRRKTHLILFFNVNGFRWGKFFFLGCSLRFKGNIAQKFFTSSRFLCYRHLKTSFLNFSLPSIFQRFSGHFEASCNLAMPFTTPLNLRLQI